jgi:pilus assembly protein Flp/PilA
MFTQFLKEEEGAQVIEYALIISMISIGLVLALQSSTIAASFGNFIGLVATCLTTGPCA